MTTSRFLQIHSLHSYTAALLNRDDTGLAKRLPYGNAQRTRISSQCLKRHWRTAEHDPHALHNIDGAKRAYRSRELVTKWVIRPLKENYPEWVIKALEPVFQKAVYGDKADQGKRSRQTLLLGEPELSWLTSEAARLAKAVNRAELDKAFAEAVTKIKAVDADKLLAEAVDRAELDAAFAEVMTKSKADNAGELAESKSKVAKALAKAVNRAELDEAFAEAVAKIKAVDADKLAEFKSKVAKALAKAVNRAESDKAFAEAVTKIKAVDADKLLAEAVNRAELDKAFAEVVTKIKAVDADKLAEFKSKVAKALAEAWSATFKNNIKALREATVLPGGLASALFGRMVTSDPAANIDAPVYVAHAFTVHAEETEGDYFTAVDDLKREEDDSGADTIQETELTSGLFYGYAVIDLPGLIKNCSDNRELAGQVVHNLIHLIAEVSPGAKRGSTAPFGRADLMLIEAGNRQPRSLAGGYRKAIHHDREKAIEALNDHLARLDETYETGEARRYLSIADTPLTGPAAGELEKLSLKALAEWAAGHVNKAPIEDTADA